jgi:hypothetical protein
VIGALFLGVPLPKNPARIACVDRTGSRVAAQAARTMRVAIELNFDRHSKATPKDFFESF